MLIYNPPHGKSIRVPKTYSDIREIRVQKKQSAQVPHTNAEPRRTTFILFNICHISFAYEKNEQSYFSIFLPFFITTPACRLPLMAQPERSYSLPSIAFVVRTDVMPDFM